MTSPELELAHVEADMDAKMHELLDGPAVDNYMQRQIQLAVELHLKSHPEDVGHLNNAKCDEIIMNWHTSHYSTDFRALTHQPHFTNHPPLQRKHGKCHPR